MSGPNDRIGKVWIKPVRASEITCICCEIAWVMVVDTSFHKLKWKMTYDLVSRSFFYLFCWGLKKVGHFFHVGWPCPTKPTTAKVQMKSTSPLLVWKTDECGCVKEIVIQTHNDAVNRLLQLVCSLSGGGPWEQYQLPDVDFKKRRVYNLQTNLML